MTHYQACLLCGVEGPQVRIRMVEWADPLTKRFEAIPACVDVAECRQRVEQQGEPWPLVPTRTERESAREQAAEAITRIHRIVEA